MDKVKGLEEVFKKTRTIFMTTFQNGRENTRAMTNFNENPYETIWFPTERGTQKVKDIEKDPRVILTFPAAKPGSFYEIEGTAEFEKQEIVDQKWEWWWLSWRPHQRDRFFFRRDRSDPNRVIINIKPESVRIITKP
jgi:general stress protein 26